MRVVVLISFFYIQLMYRKIPWNIIKNYSVVRSGISSVTNWKEQESLLRS